MSELPPHADEPSVAPAAPDPQRVPELLPEQPEDAQAETEGARVENMLPRRGRRRLGVERLLVRLVATGGVVGIGVLLGAILASSKVQGWIIGLVIALVSVILSAVLWSSREL